MPSTTMTHEELIEAAEKLVPLFRAKAREAELARRAPDDVIAAVEASGLYAMMVPKSMPRLTLAATADWCRGTSGRSGRG